MIQQPPTVFFLDENAPGTVKDGRFHLSRELEYSYGGLLRVRESSPLFLALIFFSVLFIGGIFFLENVYYFTNILVVYNFYD